MDNHQEEKQAIKKVLMQFCVPKLHGMSADEIARLILEALSDLNAKRLGEDYTKENGLAK